MGLKIVQDTLSPAAARWARANGIFKGSILKVMMAAGLTVAKGSADRAPYKDGPLEDSHKAEVIASGKERIRIEVSAGGSVNGVNVDDYVIEMHESNYNLGEASMRKQAANPAIRVGRKFMERSLEDNEDDIIKAIEDAILKEIG